MEHGTSTLFTLNFKQAVIEEIALDGLEGTTVERLLKLIEKRFKRPLTDKIKARLWQIVLACDDVIIYKLLEPRESFEILDRFDIVDPDTGHLCTPDVYLDGPYEYCPVKGEYGSCKDYDTRVLIPKNRLELQALENAIQTYGNSLVLVATLKERYRALAPHRTWSQMAALTPQQYCMLELVGKARENGQVTIGTTNLLKIMKDPKTQFYNRKMLESYGMVRGTTITQITGGRSCCTNLLRLIRFYKVKYLTTPNEGRVAEVLNYLRAKPDFCDTYGELLNHNIVNPGQLKRLKKTCLIKIERSDSPSEELPNCSRKPRKLPPPTNQLVKINTDSDLEEEEQEETADVPCQFKVGVPITRQAYEIFLEASMRGLNWQELCKTLNIGYYAARRIIRVFQKRNIIREVHDENKKIGSSPRFIAIASLNEDSKYEAEKRILLEFYGNTPTNQVQTDSEEIPAKRRKLEKTEKNKPGFDKTKPGIDETKPGIDETKPGFDESTTGSDETDPKVSSDEPEESSYKADVKEVTELKDPAPSLIEALNSKKRPTLRQLKYANGIIKHIREKQVVVGYATMSSLIAGELNIKTMDRKPIKKLIERLALDGQARIFTMKWPLKTRVEELICAPNVDMNHPMLKAKYRELYLRSLYNYEKKKPEPTAKPTHTHTTPQNNEFQSFKRYMRARKLHEFIFNLVYLSGQNKSDLGDGFTSLLDFIPEMTASLALGIMHNHDGPQIYDLKITEELLQTKLKDCPSTIFTGIFSSKKLRATLVSTLTILATFGLVQICNRSIRPGNPKNSHLLKYSFYVNRNAQLIDTRGEWPREGDSTVMNFNLQSMDDLEKYWNTLYEISTNTKVTGRDDTLQIPTAPVYSEDGAKDRDDARIVSDGKGAAGLHSAYFLDTQTLWVSNLKKHEPKPKPKLAKLKIKSVVKKKPKKKKKIIPIKKKAVKKEKIKVRGPRVRPNLNWSEYDDEVILLCRTAVYIMSHAPQPGCYTLRNTIAKELIADTQKTVYFCHRRSTARRDQRSVDLLVEEFKTRKDLLSKYDNLLVKLKRKFNYNVSHYTQEARLPVMELVWLLYQIKRSASFNRVYAIPQIAIDYKSFIENYELKLKSPPRNELYELYKSNTNPEVNTLKETIMMTLFLTSETKAVSVDTCLELYKYLSTRKESLLQSAVADLRKGGAIVGIKKFIFLQSLKNESWSEITNSGSPSSIKAFAVSKACQRKLTGRLNKEFGDEICRKVFEDLPHNTVGSPEMNCVVFEALAAGNIGIATQNIPVVTGTDELREEKMNDIDEDNNFKLKSGNVVIVNHKGVKKIVDLFEKPDYDLVFAGLISDSIVHQMEDESMSDEPIVTLLREKGEAGCSFRDLQKTWNADTLSLTNKLQDLENQHVIKRVGYFDNILVHSQFIEKWSICFSNHRIIPTPWINEDLTVNKSFLVKLCGVIVNKVFECPGITIAQLAMDCDYLASRNIQSLCEFLQHIECVTMKVATFIEPDLFSEDYGTVLVAYHKYAAHEDIAVFPSKDTLSKFVYHRKVILSSIDD